MLLFQSDLPVQKTTCSAYAAMVLRRGVLRSMSRSGGVEAHGHVGVGHVWVVGIEGRVGFGVNGSGLGGFGVDVATRVWLKDADVT